MMTKPGMMAAQKPAPKPLMSEEELYASEPEEAPATFTISKDVLPQSFPVGTHLIIVEDLGKELRLEQMTEETEAPPANAEEAEYS